MGSQMAHRKEEVGTKGTSPTPIFLHISRPRGSIAPDHFLKHMLRTDIFLEETEQGMSEAFEQSFRLCIGAPAMVVKDFLHASNGYGARDDDGANMRADAFQLLQGLNGANAAGRDPEERHWFARQDGGEPEVLDNEFGHGTKATMVFGSRENDAWRTSDRGAELLAVPGVWMARERQGQRARIEDGRIDTAATQLINDDLQRTRCVIVGSICSRDADDPLHRPFLLCILTLEE